MFPLQIQMQIKSHLNKLLLGVCADIAVKIVGGGDMNMLQSVGEQDLGSFVNEVQARIAEQV